MSCWRSIVPQKYRPNQDVLPSPLAMGVHFFTDGTAMMGDAFTERDSTGDATTQVPGFDSRWTCWACSWSGGVRRGPEGFEIGPSPLQYGPRKHGQQRTPSQLRQAEVQRATLFSRGHEYLFLICH